MSVGERTCHRFLSRLADAADPVSPRWNYAIPCSVGTSDSPISRYRLATTRRYGTVGNSLELPAGYDVVFVVELSSDEHEDDTPGQNEGCEEEQAKVQ